MPSQPIVLTEKDVKPVDTYHVSRIYRDDLHGILISEGEVGSRIERMAGELNDAFASTEPYITPIMDGSLKFFHDLFYSRHFDRRFRLNTQQLSRYGMGGATSAQKTQRTGRNLCDIRGRDVLVVEDIVDEGYTMQDYLEELRQHEPNSIQVVALLSKRSRRKAEVPIDFLGFQIPDLFVVGYGLDFKEAYRGLPHIAVLKREIYEASAAGTFPQA
jgi:hypoxanthine phosphoribosyltransferase